MTEIIIERPVLERRRLTSRVSAKSGLGKYIKNNELFIEYDEEIYADESILNIPLTATVLPLAWLSGSNIHVGALDRTFKESMDKVQETFAQMYPRIPFKTEIHAESLKDNQIGEFDSERCTGLLFSGGVDSTYSLHTNQTLHPRLIMLWGIDNFPYPEHALHWEKAASTYRDYAERKGLEFNLIKTNASQILDDRRIDHKYHKEMYNGTVRVALQHSMILLPTAAPLSIGRFNHFLIAASNSEEFDYTLRPRAARACIDEKLIWADLSVKHHGFIPRLKKVEFLCNHHRMDNLTLRVCLNSPFIDGEINDSICEKCLRTIIPIILYGVDPNTCGFHVDESTFKRLRKMWEKMKTSASHIFWRKIQDIIPDNLIVDLPGSKEFFEWFKGFDFKTTEKNWFYHDLYNALPYNLARPLEKVYAKAGIYVQDEPYRRKK